MVCIRIGELQSIFVCVHSVNGWVRVSFSMNSIMVQHGSYRPGSSMIPEVSRPFTLLDLANSVSNEWTLFCYMDWYTLKHGGNMNRKCTNNTTITWWNQTKLHGESFQLIFFERKTKNVSFAIILRYWIENRKFFYSIFLQAVASIVPPILCKTFVIIIKWNYFYVFLPFSPLKNAIRCSLL